jgi:hypothetical protein
LSTSSLTTLEDAIRHAGEGWLVDTFSPPENAMPTILRVLEEVQRESRDRLGHNGPDFSEETLVREYHRNPRQVTAFFQALGGTRTPNMLLMVWRILQGMEVKEIQLTYRRQEIFHLRVVLESPYGEEDEPYDSTDIGDFALLRHLGSLTISGLPVFDGFYAFRRHS